MYALVTGAGGFLGRYIAEQLVARGDQVRSFSRGDYPELGKLGIQLVQGDLRDPPAVARACAGVDVVFHTAGVAGIWGPRDYFHGINARGTQNVIAGCLRHDVRKLVYTSSPSVTFDGSDQLRVDESAAYPERWLCHYAHSKALAEQQVLAANVDARLATCALRPHLIWGPRDEHLIPRLLDRARRGRLIQVGNGTNLVDISYVENAATAHLQAADALDHESPVAGQAYFLSQGEPVNCWDWIGEILQIADLPPIKRSISQVGAWRVGHLLELTYRTLGLRTEPSMTRFLAAQLATSHYFDISKAQRDFGYKPHISTKEGMRRLTQWLRERS